MYFNPLTAFFSLFAIVMLHLQILQEEKYLTATLTLSKRLDKPRFLIYNSNYK